MNSNVKSFSLATAIVLALAGCGSGAGNGNLSTSNTSTQSAAKGTSSYTIGFIPGVTTDAFYISMMKGAKDEAKKLGINLDIQGGTQWNYTLQTPIVSGMVSRQVNCLIIAPNDANAMVGPLRQAVDAKIPVITVDTTISDNSILTSQITSDNSQGGTVAADEMAKLIGNSGDVVEINVTPGISTTDERQQAFISEMKKYPKINVLTPQYSNDQQNTAASETENILLSHPNLKGVFATNVVNAGGVAQALKAKGVQGKVKLIAYDGEPLEVSDLKDGSIQAIVVQKPYLEGQMAVQYAYDLLTGKKSDIQQKVVLPNVIATPNNMNNPDVSPWFY